MLSAPFLVLKSLIRKPSRAFSNRHRPFWLIDQLNRLTYSAERFLMPTKHQNNWKNSGNSDFGFASLRLDDTQRAHFEGWLKENEQGFEEIVASLILTGHKSSFSWDENSDCFIASLTCFDSKSPNNHTVMTSRAPEWFTALMMNCYKALVLCSDRPWPKTSKENNWG